ncbi:MAG: restriction endonuclease subunit S [Elusimicrobia bacterium]|nr:restriction endonuclease subunit S [Elusimicrobiota bacterium]
MATTSSTSRRKILQGAVQTDSERSQSHMTEVGQIPRDWRLASLGSLFDVQQGKAMSAESRGGPSPRPFLRTSNVLWGKINLSSVDRMHFTDAESKKLELQLGDLLVCEGGEVGRTAIWSNELPDCLYQNHIHRLRRIVPHIEPRFAMYWLQEVILHRKVYEGAANRTTIPNLSSARLKEFAIPLPQLDEQRAISTVLAKVEAAVETQSKTIAALRELKAATLREVFPQESDSKYSWGHLDKICLKVRMASPEKEFEYVDVSAVSNEDYCITSTAAHTPESAPSRARKPIMSGDVIVATVRPTLKRVALVPHKLDGQFCSTAFCVLRADRDQLLPQFLYYAVQRPEFFEALGRVQHGASYPAVTDTDVRRQKVPLLPLNQQQKVADTLSAIDQSTLTATAKENELNSLFASMLHQLMTGKVRIAP